MTALAPRAAYLTFLVLLSALHLNAVVTEQSLLVSIEEVLPELLNKTTDLSEQTAPKTSEVEAASRAKRVWTKIPGANWNWGVACTISVGGGVLLAGVSGLPLATAVTLVYLFAGFAAAAELPPFETVYAPKVVPFVDGSAYTAKPQRDFSILQSATISATGHSFLLLCRMYVNGYRVHDFTWGDRKKIFGNIRYEHPTAWHEEYWTKEDAFNSALPRYGVETTFHNELSFNILPRHQGVHVIDALDLRTEAAAFSARVQAGARAAGDAPAADALGEVTNWKAEYRAFAQRKADLSAREEEMYFTDNQNSSESLEGTEFGEMTELLETVDLALGTDLNLACATINSLCEVLGKPQVTPKRSPAPFDGLEFARREL